jgi:hypothetical protein
MGTVYLAGAYAFRKLLTMGTSESTVGAAVYKVSSSWTGFDFTIYNSIQGFE